MFDRFKEKIRNNDYPIELVEMDVAQLSLNKKFGLILLPFHSITEILSTKKQVEALKSTSNHLTENGVFILTLQNPITRLRLADGTMRVLGEFPLDESRQLVISYMNQYNESEKIVSGFQYYEIYDFSNTLIEKRFLEINFKPITASTLKEMLRETNLEIIDMFGDYSYNRFDEESSTFMVYKMIKKCTKAQHTI